jgi:transposase
MRGHRERSGSLFSYVSIEERIPANHPLRRIRKLADQALVRLNLTFCELYAAGGRLSVPPELLLAASLLQAFYGIRSERLLLEQLLYNLLFYRFVSSRPRLNGPTVSRIHHRHHQALARVSGNRKETGRVRKGISTVSS